MSPHAALGTPSTRRPRRRGLVVSASLAALAVGGTCALTSGAIFTDTQLNTNNLFSAGTVKLATSPQTSVFNVSDMVPGDIYTEPITVTNTGSLQLRYAVTSLTGGPLTSALTLK